MPCTRFYPSTLELLRQRLALLFADLSLHVKIALLAYNDAGDMLGTCVVQDLVVDRLHHLEAIAGCDRVDQDVSVYTYGMLGIEDRVLILSGSVDYVTGIRASLVLDTLCERCLDGRIVGIDKDVLHVPHDQSGFACDNLGGQPTDLQLTLRYSPTLRLPRTANFRFVSLLLAAAMV